LEVGGTVKKHRLNPDQVFGRIDSLEERLSKVETDVRWMREILMRIEGRLWALLAGIALAILSSILGAMLG